MRLRKLNLLIPIIFLFVTACQNHSSNPASPGADFVSLPLFLNQWGGTGTANGLFGQMGGLTIDSNNNIYVCDSGNNRIEKFDINGNFLMKWGVAGSSSSQFNSPQGVASFAGSIFVVDSGNNRVQAFDGVGNHLADWGSGGSGVSQLNSPQGIAINQNGDFYVTDTGNNRVEKFFAGGSTPITWGGPGSGIGLFQSPTGIAVDSAGNVFVSDTLNNRTQKFNSAGGYQNQWGVFGTSSGQFRSPLGLTFDGAGNLFVADSANSRIQEFDSSITFVTQWGGQGNNLGQFQIPAGIIVSGTPTFYYIADTGSNFIKKFGPPTTYSIFPNPVPPGDNLTVSFNAASFVGFQIQVENLDGNLVFNYQGQAVAGNNVVQWDGKSGGVRVQSGVYLIYLNLGNSQVSGKVSILN